MASYVKAVVSSDSKNAVAALYAVLEKRLDNIILKSGLAKSRFQARQIVSHGHIKVNNKKISIPSYSVSDKDVITVKDSSKEKPLFLDFPERAKDFNTPSWLKVSPNEYSIQVNGEPIFKTTEVPFNLSDVIQFYKR